MLRLLSVLFVATSIVPLVATSASATVIDIANAGFENPDPPHGTPGGADPDPSANPWGIPDGWTVGGSAGKTRYAVGDDCFLQYWGGVVQPHSGYGMGWMNPNSGSEGSLSQVLKVGASNLSVNLGDKIAVSFYETKWGDTATDDELAAKLWAGPVGTGTLLISTVWSNASMGGVWDQRSFEYTATSDAVGHDIYLELVRPTQTNSNQVMLDDVSATWTPIPEPNVLALLSSGAMGLLSYAWRKRKQIN